MPRARAAALSAVLSLAVLPCLAGCSGEQAVVRPDASAASGPGARWGVEVQAPRRLAAGYLVELQLRVLDPDRAAPLFDATAPARLVGDRSGKVLASVGKALGGARPEAGRAYTLRFDNTQNAVAAGDRVTLVLGPLEVRELAVGE